VCTQRTAAQKKSDGIGLKKRRRKLKDYSHAYAMHVSWNADCCEPFFVLLWAQPCRWKIEKKTGISVLIAHSTQGWTNAS
jgi:hypothetical protein